ncbi:hypothetical protein QGX11_gp034 [Pseudomonas phage PPSC2]|uniref:DUF4326 domain-containing protein n=1 Tax=Pseudomonas phage PPSC2 TaxID=2041350 RepID=A0A2R2YAP7_9CAUD|nr:hypothetical protein QGX11_gp034 [Pseudomonas phage PPSC2]ATN92797.1 hypothetical protein PPSC2_34 [Pseudomonas phage PPSC2]
MCQVVNKKHMSVNMTDPDIVYIGRGSIWGNPFSHKAGTKAIWKVKTRDEAIYNYRSYLWAAITKGDITLEMLKELDGKRLACYCAPLACHGDIIKRAVQWAKEQ